MSYSSERRPESGLPPSLAGQPRVRMAVLRMTRRRQCKRLCLGKDVSL